MPVPKKKMPEDLRSLARSYTNFCIRGLASIATRSENDNARVAAIGMLLDRGWGKAATVIDPDGGDVVVTIRQIVQRIGEPQQQLTIEHDDSELDEQGR